MEKKYFKIFLPLLIILTLLVARSVFSYVASSSNYMMQFDSINIGGNYSTSTLYSEEDTLGEFGTGYSTSTNYQMHAGYQQRDEVYITMNISSPSVNMSPAIGGLSGGVADGNVQIGVETNNIIGYSLYVRATSSPALKCSSSCNVGVDNFANYNPGSIPSYNWNAPNNTSTFGFTPEGKDITQAFKDDGNTCNAGGFNTTDKCWWFFNTSDYLIANSGQSNQLDNTTTTIKFRAESASNNVQTAGTYQATIIVTAVAN